MTERKTLTVSKAAYEAADANRRDGESWTEYHKRVADTSDEHTLNTATVENIDELARAVGDEVENRLARR